MKNKTKLPPIPTEKTCPICGTIFYRRESEKSTDWRARATCSKKCGHKAISKKKKGWKGYFQWLLEHEGPEAVAAYKEKRKKTYKTTYQRLIDKYGPKRAPAEFEKYKKRMSKRNKGQKCQYDLLVAKYGEEEATKRYNKTRKKISKIVKKRGKNVKRLLYEKYGEKEGERRYKAMRKKMSIKKKQYLKDNPDKIPYLLYNSSKMSYPEKIMYEVLTKANIQFHYNYPIGGYAYDFAIINKKIDIEVDGALHLRSDIAKRDKIRDKYTKSIGWKVLRFTAKEVMYDTENVLKRIKLFIKRKL
jgi:very-short-patch-repair endonuclease